MSKFNSLQLVTVAAALAVSAGCATHQAAQSSETTNNAEMATMETETAEAEAEMSTDTGPLLTEWNTPFGVPPFDEIKNEHYLPAFRQTMEEQQQEITEIVAKPEPATFANTIEALERTGKGLTKVANVFYSLNSAHTNDVIKEVASTIAPELSAHGDDIAFNKPLFERVKAVYDQREDLGLSVEQLRLLEETHKGFVRSGVGLDDAAQAEMRRINGQLAELSQEFQNNLLAETNDFFIHTTDSAALGDLPTSLVALAADEAKKREFEDGWVFTIQRPSINPFLQYSPDRELRKQLFMAYALRGDNGNDNDNNQVLATMASLRAEKAGILGYDSHSHFVLSDAMAETPDRVYQLLDQVWDPAINVAKKDRGDLEAMMHADGIEGELQGWDWRHYQEKVRKARYDLDEEILRPYFEVNAVRDGVFTVANRLYGLTFHQLDGVPVWQQDQQVFEVKEADGSHVGILYMDFFTRDSKRGGAWMNDLRAQSKLDGDIKPIVTNNFNFPPPTADGPSLLSFTNAQTLFHEMGHALHGLLSDVTYESLSGTNVPRDFVEFPSQVMENWMAHPEVLKLYAKHYQTGEVIPDELIAKITAADKFGQGFATVEYVAASYLDMAWHTLTEPQELVPDEIEEAEMARIGLIDQIIPRYRNTYFAHIFAGGYSSGYYSYLWSEVLDADAFEAFKETDVFNAEVAARYRRMLSKGGSEPGMDLYREFRGRDPIIDPLLERRGLVQGEATE